MTTSTKNNLPSNDVLYPPSFIKPSAFGRLLLASMVSTVCAMYVQHAHGANGIVDGTQLKESVLKYQDVTYPEVAEGTQQISEDKIRALAEGATWHHLLLLDAKAKPTIKESVSDTSFYLANGVALDELNAIIGAIKTRSEVVCDFPARSHFAAQALDLVLDDSHCTAFHKWVKQHDAKALSLVFAEEHPNSLGSAFAHVMIKADTKDSLASGQDNDAFAINYTVARDKEDGEAEASARSMLGSYAGVMEFYDYDEKRDVYLMDDERDIWEYRLNLTQEEVVQIMRHVWETKNVKRPYFFTHDNCATEILRLIDVVRGSELRRQAGKVVIPNEVARLLNSQGLVSDTKYLPSKSSVAQAQKNSASPMPVSAIISDNNPAYASLTHRVGLSVGHDDSFQGTSTDQGDGVIYGLSLRSAYHDVLDRPMGVRQYLDVSMLSVDARYDDRLKIDKVTIFSTRSYNPANTAKAHKGMAWGQHLHLRQAMDASDVTNDDHLVIEARLEKGKSWTLGQGAAGTSALSDTLCYALGGYGGQVGHINKGYRVGAGLNLGCIHHVSDDLRMTGEFALPVWYHHNDGDTRFLYVQPALSVGVQYDVSPRHALRLTGKAERGHKDTHEEVSLAVLTYF